MVAAWRAGPGISPHPRSSWWDRPCPRSLTAWSHCPKWPHRRRVKASRRPPRVTHAHRQRARSRRQAAATSRFHRSTGPASTASPPASRDGHRAARAMAAAHARRPRMGMRRALELEQEHYGQRARSQRRSFIAQTLPRPLILSKTSPRIPRPFITQISPLDFLCKAEGCVQGEDSATAVMQKSRRAASRNAPYACSVFVGMRRHAL